jgi:carboxymethylenebutenolidase
MGGGYSLDVALQEPTLAADVINYGHLATDLDALKKINAPILGLFGGQDRGITPDDVKKFGATLDQLGKKIDVKIYDDAGHAFENPNNKDGYRAADAADAWNRTVAFLADEFEEIAGTGCPRPMSRCLCETWGFSPPLFAHVTAKPESRETRKPEV